MCTEICWVSKSVLGAVKLIEQLSEELKSHFGNLIGVMTVTFSHPVFFLVSSAA